MPPRPIYEAENLNPAYQLRYAWTAWPSRGPVPEPLADEAWRNLQTAWDSDGLRALEPTWSRDKIQILFSTTPDVNPVFLAARAKGRLDHAYRQAGQACEFSRKVGLRSVGENTRADVEQYIASQVSRASFADSQYQRSLEKFIVCDSTVLLAEPSETRSGRYWYNLHIVLVSADRAPFAEPELGLIRDRSLEIAAKKGHRISRLAVMPDHLHIALRGNLDHSPQEIALAFQNNLAFALGQNAVWKHTYYAGTFSEYDMDAIRTAKSSQRSG